MTLAAARDDFSVGCLLGLLAGEGHFGGDGRQPQITLRMHVRHEGLFRWLQANFPGGRLYGPYDHAGRRYYQWMARGDYLRNVIVPLIDSRRDWLDDHVRSRYEDMCERYRIRRAQEQGSGGGLGTVQPDGTGPVVRMYDWTS
jgi:hypothetical protein